ncbi:helix-turn-helix domain-containing protein [Streptomyces sp. NBC_01613]|uniref:helix-turn-helix domain-containing protein n=1 Tax=Streptomyces sp. NBC_01613 TaxID=2975896 RepID=UPI003862E011
MLADEVAERYGTTRQSLHAWRTRFEQEGLPGLADRSLRWQASPSRLPASVEAAVCELRRQHPRWGARRIRHELAQRDLPQTHSSATVHQLDELEHLAPRRSRRQLRHHLGGQLLHHHAVSHCTPPCS